MDTETTFEQISSFVQSGRAKDVERLIESALAEGVNAEDILQKGLLHGMDIIGEKFKRDEVYVPEVLIAARAMNMGIEKLRPHLASGSEHSKGTAVIGTVRGDQHDIGKNLVRIMCEGKGIEMIDLGVNVPPAAFLDAAEKHNAGVIICSALLTTTMPAMCDVVEEAKRRGVREKVRIMVGGAPVTQSFCDEIEADCYTEDAASAAEAAAAFLAASKNGEASGLIAKDPR